MTTSCAVSRRPRRRPGSAVSVSPGVAIVRAGWCGLAWLGVALRRLLAALSARAIPAVKGPAWVPGGWLGELGAGARGDNAGPLRRARPRARAPPRAPIPGLRGGDAADREHARFSDPVERRSSTPLNRPVRPPRHHVPGSWGMFRPDRLRQQIRWEPRPAARPRGGRGYAAVNRVTRFGAPPLEGFGARGGAPRAVLARAGADADFQANHLGSGRFPPPRGVG